MKIKNNTFKTGLIALLILLVLAGVYYFTKKSLPQMPKKETVITEKAVLRKEAPKKIPVKVETREKKEEAPSLKELPKLQPEEEPEVPAGKEKVKTAHFVTEPKEIKIEVEEGQRGQVTFVLTNDGAKSASVNIYKSDQNESLLESEARIEEILKHKMEVLSAEKTKKDISQAALFYGTPWLMPHPYYTILESAKSQDIQLTVNAAELKAGEYQTNLIILGVNKEESLIVPVYVEVKGAPKIQFVKIEIDDGFSPDTRGNSNNVANPGEKVAFTVYLENVGEVSAEDLTLEISSEECTIDIGKAGVPSVGAGGQFPARFLIEVPLDAHPTIPPSVILVTTDREGKQWEESFYVGEPGKFEYPTGALLSDKEKERMQKQFGPQQLDEEQVEPETEPKE